ncbi:T9SS type A sorting domain-containing protein [bacterium]|nr:T9SS type A sorting domain-containing protein [bacterium]
MFIKNKLTALCLLAAFGFAMSFNLYADEKKNSRKKGLTQKMTAVSCEYIDINQIEAAILNNGMFGAYFDGEMGGLFYPKGQRENSILYCAGLHLLGLHDGEVRTAAVQHATEFQPGVILPGGNPADENNLEFKVYKYNKGDVVDQVAIDQGCPSQVIGDQMLWSVYNDLGNEHMNLFERPPIGVEVQQTTWAYDRPGALGKTIFIRYRIINKNPDGNDLDSAYVGMWYDADIGNCNDDYTGCDPALGIAYVYNGDNNDDDHYGAGAPAIGSDFFQGPIVADPGGSDLVLNNGRVYFESKMLNMTSYFVYLGGSPITGMNDPSKNNEGALMLYDNVRGLRSNGSPWIDPTTGQITTFPFSGDPVTGTGWLLRHITHPSDNRMGHASGPFTFAVGDTQNIVIGVVIGDGGAVGGDNIASVALMKYNDAQVQQIYDFNFVMPDLIPTPLLKVSSLDEELILTWDDAAVSFMSEGYEFEGFNVWMSYLDTSWTRIATYDIKNGITTVWGSKFDLDISSHIESPVQYGTDSGLRYYLNVNSNLVSSKPLVNGKIYNFAVTAYAVNEFGTPRSMETLPAAVCGVPQCPVLDEQINVETSTTIEVTHASGPSQGVVTVEVVDPRKVTGHDYSVDFFNVEVYEQNGEEIDTTMELRWRLVDVTSGVTVLDNMTRQNQGSDWLPVDGLLINFSAPPIGIRDIVELNDTGAIIDSNLHHNLNAPVNRVDNAVFYIHIQGEEDAPWQDRLNWRGNMTSEDYEIRFVDISEGQIILDIWGNYLLNGYQSGPVGATVADVSNYIPVYTDTDNGRLPFQVWKIDMDGTRTQVHCGMHDTNENGYWDGGYSCDSPWSDVNYERLYATDKPYDEAAILADGGVSVTDDFMWGEWWDSGHTFGRVIFSMYLDEWSANATGNYFTEPPSTGTIINIRTNKPNSVLDVFTFSTADLNPTKSAEIAKERLEDINVFPNPYKGSVSVNGTVYTNQITFNRLPADNCTIRIFSLSGNLVRTLVHENGTPFEKWDITNDGAWDVASGMYIVHIETEFGNRILKLAIIRQNISVDY